MDSVRANQFTEPLSETILTLQREVHRLFNDTTDLPANGLRQTLFRRRSRVIEKAADLLDRSARLLLTVRDHEAGHGGYEGEWDCLQRRVDELKENWHSLQNEASDIMTECLVLDLGGGG